MRKRGRPPYPDILTPREWEVLALLRDGLTNEQIAERLNVTRHAVRYHVSGILSKLGVSSREEAAAWQPEKAKPMWAGALAFALWPLKHLPLGVAARATVAAAAIATAGGIGVLAWGLVVTNRDDNDGQAELTPTPAFIAFVETMSWSQVPTAVNQETDRVMAAVKAGTLPEEMSCSLGTSTSDTSPGHFLTELVVACGFDTDHASFVFETRRSWNSDQPPPGTAPPGLRDELREMVDFIVAGRLDSGQTAILWYNPKAWDVAWFVLPRPRVLDVVDAEINGLVEANWLDYDSYSFGGSDTWYESHYDYFTGELRVAIGPSGQTAATMLGWPKPPWPVPRPLPEPDVPTEEIAEALHELVGAIISGDLGDGDTAVLWYKPEEGEVLTWVGANAWRDLFGLAARES
jgi:DNA-binding CsgD family transcriptional regulator